jgi:HK97 family phage major capsid protein
MNPRELRQQLADLVQAMESLNSTAETEERDLTADEQTQYDQALEEAQTLRRRIARIEATGDLAGEVRGTQATRVAGAPSVNRIGRGDTAERAFAHWLRTGDDGGLRELRASNDTDMNIGTSADGGYAVPTGHYQGIIARRDEGMLATQLGVMDIPGTGTTVNVPVDAEADGEFVSTNEAAAYDRDAPALGQVQMTLVKYTKKVELSVELLEDEDSRLLDFLNNFVGRGLAKTHNSLLLTAALAGGTAALTLDAAAAVGATELPELVYTLAGEYAEGSAWVMKRASEGAIRGLSGDVFLYAPTPGGSDRGRPEIWGYPVYNSEYMPAIGAGNKSLIFGNWGFVGKREAPTMTVLRDPYTLAATGQIRFVYMFRAVYKVLQAEAIVYATHPTA